MVSQFNKSIRMYNGVPHKTRTGMWVFYEVFLRSGNASKCGEKIGQICSDFVSNGLLYVEMRRDIIRRFKV